MSEARRQQDLLRALTDPAVACAGLRETDQRAARGLEAYRANAEAIAERALAAAFATVQKMVGQPDFRHLARACWQAHPPLRGDLGEWGDAFPAWLQAHGAMAAWPYLADCARLDLALHRSERAADAEFDAASLALLGNTDPACLRVQLMPGTALVRSAWPIVRIHRAHQLDGAQAEHAFEQVRAAMAAQQAEDALVVRDGWRAVVHALDADRALFMQLVLDGASLGAALEGAGQAFDFGAWLQDAIRGSWLQGVVACDD